MAFSNEEAESQMNGCHTSHLPNGHANTAAPVRDINQELHAAIASIISDETNHCPPVDQLFDDQSVKFVHQHAVHGPLLIELNIAPELQTGDDRLIVGTLDRHCFADKLASLCTEQEEEVQIHLSLSDSTDILEAELYRASENANRIPSCSHQVLYTGRATRKGTTLEVWVEERFRPSETSNETRGLFTANEVNGALGLLSFSQSLPCLVHETLHGELDSDSPSPSNSLRSSSSHELVIDCDASVDSTEHFEDRDEGHTKASTVSAEGQGGNQEATTGDSCDPCFDVTHPQTDKSPPAQSPAAQSPAARSDCTISDVTDAILKELGMAGIPEFCINANAPRVTNHRLASPPLPPSTMRAPNIDLNADHQPPIATVPTLPCPRQQPVTVIQQLFSASPSTMASGSLSAQAPFNQFDVHWSMTAPPLRLADPGAFAINALERTPAPVPTSSVAGPATVTNQALRCTYSPNQCPPGDYSIQALSSLTETLGRPSVIHAPPRPQLHNANMAPPQFNPIESGPSPPILPHFSPELLAQIHNVSVNYLNLNLEAFDALKPYLHGCLSPDQDPSLITAAILNSILNFQVNGIAQMAYSRRCAREQELSANKLSSSQPVASTSSYTFANGPQRGSVSTSCQPLESHPIDLTCDPHRVLPLKRCRGRPRGAYKLTADRAVSIDAFIIPESSITTVDNPHSNKDKWLAKNEAKITRQDDDDLPIKRRRGRKPKVPTFDASTQVSSPSTLLNATKYVKNEIGPSGEPFAHWKAQPFKQHFGYGTSEALMQQQLNWTTYRNFSQINAPRINAVPMDRPQLYQRRPSYPYIRPSRHSVIQHAANPHASLYQSQTAMKCDPLKPPHLSKPLGPVGRWRALEPYHPRMLRTSPIPSASRVSLPGASPTLPHQSANQPRFSSTRVEPPDMKQRFQVFYNPHNSPFDDYYVLNQKAEAQAALYNAKRQQFLPSASSIPSV